jgi:hypothetical protein
MSKAYKTKWIVHRCRDCTRFQRIEPCFSVGFLVSVLRLCDPGSIGKMRTGSKGEHAHRFPKCSVAMVHSLNVQNLAMNCRLNDTFTTSNILSVMKVHTTNYYNTFITVADDSKATQGEIPPQKGDAKTMANLQFELIAEHPYKYTSDDVLFHCYAEKNKVARKDLAAAREEFFSRGQACLRASPLTKRYGYGVHHDQDGKVALFGRETDEYKALENDKKLQIVKAMKSAR